MGRYHFTCVHCGVPFEVSDMYDPAKISPLNVNARNSVGCPKCHKPNVLPGNEVIPPTDYNFAGVEHLPRPYAERVPSASELVALHSSFVSNMDRVIVLGSMQPILRNQWQRLIGERPSRHPASPHHGSVIAEGMWAQFCTTDEILNHVQTTGITHIAESILSAMIISAWTAFEVLAGDLWVAALNSRPRLGFAAINADPAPIPGESEPERRKRARITMPSELLLKPGFDHTKSMGTVLREKFVFTNRHSTEEAYSKVFKRDRAKIESVFGEQRLNWLAELRHVIVHKAALADDDFLRGTSTHPVFRQLHESDEVPIDGTIVAELATAAITQGIALLDFVDQWLKNNPA
jgi:hypothetical protein